MKWKNRLFNRWSIDTVKQRIIKLDYVFDVRYEKPIEGKYLFHVFVDDITERVQAMVHAGIKQAVGRIPDGIKIDVLLYKS